MHPTTTTCRTLTIKTQLRLCFRSKKRTQIVFAIFSWWPCESRRYSMRLGEMLGETLSEAQSVKHSVRRSIGVTAGCHYRPWYMCLDAYLFVYEASCVALRANSRSSSAGASTSHSMYIDIYVDIYIKASRTSNRTKHKVPTKYQQSIVFAQSTVTVQNS